MPYVAGVDIGNSTTEVALAELTDSGEVRFLSSSLVRTIGIKGTVQNVVGVIEAMNRALALVGMARHQISLTLLNEATPVIGDVAMETITETVITESAMIGHNPSTPGGQGLGVGFTIPLAELGTASSEKRWVVIIPGAVDFTDAASRLNQATASGLQVVGAIAQKDDAVLINNRLQHHIPIVDEVKHIDRVPVNMQAAVEVAGPGRAIEKLSNPYDLATLFQLDPDETRRVVPIAHALAGARSAVVIRTPRGDIEERRIPAGHIVLIGQNRKVEIAVEEGAEAIMHSLGDVAPLAEVQAETGTNVGGMFEHVRQVMAELTDQSVAAIRVQDILAVDTFKPQQIQGSLAGEYAMGNAVGLAAMVSTHKLPMQRLAGQLQDEIKVPVAVGGVEAEMAIRGALTTPGTTSPLAILDLGGGSTDASLINSSGEISSVHLAGAGDMVTMLIATELGLEDRGLAEQIKRSPLAKAESLFHLRHEDGTVQFFQEPLDPRFFGRVVVLSENGLIPLETRELLPKIVAVRQEAKRKVFVQNSLRALQRIAPAGNLRLISFVVLVGGSALDFEIPQMIAEALIAYGVVTGRANVRATEGPRNAVATGLILAQAGRQAP